MEAIKLPQIKNLEEITPEQAEQYIRYVAELRHQQRRWFALHKSDALEASKRMERELDAFNNELFNPLPKLF